MNFGEPKAPDLQKKKKKKKKKEAAEISFPHKK